MKRILASILSAALLLALLSGCTIAMIKDPVTLPAPSENVESAEPAGLPAPTPTSANQPTHHPEETHHVEPTHHPEETHHVEPTDHPEPTHHGTVTPPPTSAPAAGVDLAAFYQKVTSQNEFGFLQLASPEMLDGYYPGMTGIQTEQCLVYICGISVNNGEFGLVQVKNSSDVAAVKAVFQARIDYMAGDGNGPGGTQYPMVMKQWEENSRVVSNGNYVMMVVHENCDDIVSQFNALF